MSPAQEHGGRPPQAPRSVSSLPLGCKVRFIRSEAPNAYRRFKDQAATVVTHNRTDGEVGLIFGYAAKRPDGRGWQWGNNHITWALPRELEQVS